ncbi:3-oxoacyl-ACP synthase III family protein [Amycolatopsis saalfeldensis]|uniref:3-oxoacyl-[acyl-carrier-protein] synthase-3 n=1 Tax=Amycolatopsis saalfeldensis TaxID=394193 RepID=A0A1H8XC60_9PSEU|nr:ketoacyl-ACP synthase III [Amycolatopsis saalfeldensis]SEP37564.1 3-oxoacyl-[acyl-carrier-protein] synthase-3 [Amycolatopsis saalfeldensis]
MTQRTIGLLGTGSYVPDRVVTNEEIVAMVPNITTEWIMRKTGIATRRYAAADEATSDLAAKAALRALDSANLTPNRIDYLIVSTSTGDFPQPPTACVVQNLIGSHDAACFDINVVCAGFPYGLEIARRLVAAQPDAHAMVIGADLYSRFLNYDDRSTSVLLGDGAGAAIVGEVPEGRGFLNVHLSSHGDAQDLIKVPAGGSRTPTTEETLAAGGHLFTMQGRAVRDFVLDNVPQILDKLVTDAGASLADVRCFVPHQANGVLLDHLVEACGLTDTHTHRVVERYGNLGSASVPVTLDDAARSGMIHDEDLVLLAAFGGGMSVGATLLRWSASA